MALTWKRGLPFQHGGAVLEGAAASRPAAASAPDAIYFATDTGGASYSDGATWAVIPYSDVSGSAVKSFDGSGGALTGDVILAAGTNVTLGQAGQTVTINAATSGGGGIGTKLFDSTLGADAASIDTGAGVIAAGHDVIEVHIIARTSQAVAQSTIVVNVNADTSAIYDRTRTSTVSATVSGATSLAGTGWTLNAPGDSDQAGSAGAVKLVIPGYDQTTFHKEATAAEAVSDSTAANNISGVWALRWRSTAAITRLAVAAGSGNLRAGSRLIVYGLT